MYYGKICSEFRCEPGAAKLGCSQMLALSKLEEEHEISDRLCARACYRIRGLVVDDELVAGPDRCNRLGTSVEVGRDHDGTHPSGNRSTLPQGQKYLSERSLMLEKMRLKLRLRRLKKQCEDLAFELRLAEFSLEDLHPESLELVVREGWLDIIVRSLVATEAEIKEIETSLSRN